MRLLKFISVFLGTALVTFGLVLGLNWKTFTIFLENRDSLTEGSEWIYKTHSLKGLSEFIGENPERNSFSRLQLNTPEKAIHFMEDEKRSLGTLSNLFLLIAYSIQFNQGVFNGSESVSWEEVSRYQLPEVGESVHREAFREAEKRGWLIGDTIELSNALLLLTEYNSTALSDYLWWKLDPDVWNTIPTQFTLSDTDMPLPFSGLYLALLPSVQQMEIEELLRETNTFTNQQWRAHVAALSSNFARDEQFRSHVNGILEKDGLGLTFMQQRDLLARFPKSTTAELSRLLSLILTDHLSADFPNTDLKNWLRWPFRNSSLLGRDATDYGALYDNRIGLLAGISFGTSAYTGEETVQVLIMDNLPVGFWFHASGSHMQQDLLQRLIFDPAMIQQMERTTRLNFN